MEFDGVDMKESLVSLNIVGQGPTLEPRTSSEPSKLPMAGLMIFRAHLVNAKRTLPWTEIRPNLTPDQTFASIEIDEIR